MRWPSCCCTELPEYDQEMEVQHRAEHWLSCTLPAVPFSPMWYHENITSLSTKKPESNDCPSYKHSFKLDHICVLANRTKSELRLDWGGNEHTKSKRQDINRGTSSVLETHQMEIPSNADTLLFHSLKEAPLTRLNTPLSPEERLYELYQSPTEVWRCRTSV